MACYYLAVFYLRARLFLFAQRQTRRPLGEGGTASAVTEGVLRRACDTTSRLISCTGDSRRHSLLLSGDMQPLRSIVFALNLLCAFVGDGATTSRKPISRT